MSQTKAARVLHESRCFLVQSSTLVQQACRGTQIRLEAAAELLPSSLLSSFLLLLAPKLVRPNCARREEGGCGPTTSVNSVRERIQIGISAVNYMPKIHTISVAGGRKLDLENAESVEPKNPLPPPIRLFWLHRANAEKAPSRRSGSSAAPAARES